MYLPTTKDGMNSAVGQYIYSLVEINRLRNYEAFVASGKANDPDYNPFAPQKSEPKKSDDEKFKEFCDKVRMGIGSR